MLTTVTFSLRANGPVNEHIGGMLGSYIAILTAVLVVNGPRIPVLQDMPVLVLWFLPTIIGAPLIALVSRRYVPKSKRKSA
jgi:hypothetical protein